MFDIPFLDIPPLRRAAGSVRLPGSKSISNRVLLLAGLAEGHTRLHGLLDSDDTRVMREALQALGCRISTLPRDVLLVEGLGGRLKSPRAVLWLGNAGTAMRPLTAALALLSSTQGGDFELRGVPRMHQRPIGDLVDTLRALGCRIDDLGQPGYPPLRVHGPIGTPLALAQPLRVRGDVSSQFLTALLMALPLVSEQHDLHIEVQGELISTPYVRITLELMARFGVSVQRDGWSRFIVPRGSRIRSPGDFDVEADASSASYFIALGAIAATAAQPLRIEGVGSASIQGDIAFVQAVEAMGARVQSSRTALQVSRGAWPLRALTLDCNAMPDAAMTLCALALFATGTTRLTHIGSWRVKETDRIAAMATELRKLGAKVESGDDFIAVTAPSTWRAAALHTYDDHRMAMCLSLASLNALAATDAFDGPGLPVRILDPRCVAKTYPDYFEAFFAVTSADAQDLPVITVDGPTASGKGTLAAALAATLGYHLLDSGALYRATALAAIEDGVDGADEQALARIAATLDLRFEGAAIKLRGKSASDALRREAVGVMASRISAWPSVRGALHALQLSFRCVPGLVADGRDMGTVLFPDAVLKVFLTASAEHRAQRRHKQLISKGIQTRIEDLRADLEARDRRDQNRAVAPLRPAEDAMLLDNSALSVDESVDQVLRWWQQRRPFDQVV